jgi:putative SOS response-associated peptidase YedK
MCGRFALYSSFQSIKEYADILAELEELDANYNVAPGQNIPVIIKKNDGNHLEFCKWGLIPFWAKDPKIGYKMINTRAETINAKPSFKYAFQKRRCLIPANGFYEWRKEDKQPFYIHLKDRELFTFAGIWENWKSPEGESVQTCSIITTSANDSLEKIHNRMPVILTQKSESIWLANEDPGKLIELLQPHPQNEISHHEVSKEVNSVRNNFPELINQNYFAK